MELPAPNKETWWYDEYATMAEEHRKEIERVEMEVKMAVSKAGMAAAMAAAAGGVSYDPNLPIMPDNTMSINPTAFTEDTALRIASKNLLRCHSNMSLDMIEQVGDHYKTKMKVEMMDTMRQEIMNKTKFTMIQDNSYYRMNFKAQVYVFSENELKEFIRKILK